MAKKTLRNAKEHKNKQKRFVIFMCFKAKNSLFSPVFKINEQIKQQQQLLFININLNADVTLLLQFKNAKYSRI